MCKVTFGNSPSRIIWFSYNLTVMIKKNFVDYSRYCSSKDFLCLYIPSCCKASFWIFWSSTNRDARHQGLSWNTFLQLHIQMNGIFVLSQTERKSKFSKTLNCLLLQSMYWLRSSKDLFCIRVKMKRHSQKRLYQSLTLPLGDSCFIC